MTNFPLTSIHTHLYLPQTPSTSLLLSLELREKFISETLVRLQRSAAELVMSPCVYELHLRLYS